MEQQLTLEEVALLLGQKELELHLLRKKVAEYESMRGSQVPQSEGKPEDK